MMKSLSISLTDVLLTVVFLAGLGLIVAGVAMLSHAAALIVAGLALATVTFLLGVAPRRSRFDEDAE